MRPEKLYETKNPSAGRYHYQTDLSVIYASVVPKISVKECSGGGVVLLLAVMVGALVDGGGGSRPGTSRSMRWVWIWVWLVSR